MARRSSSPLYAERGINAFAMEFMPRITRAQTMDVLSSQANLAGYRAVIDAAAEFGRGLPDDDDGGRHRGAGPRLRHGRRRGGAAGDRDGPAPGRHRQRRPTCARRPRSRCRASAPPSWRSRMRSSSRPRPPRGYAKPMSAEYQQKQAALVAETYQEAGHRHHHRADPRPAGAGAGERGDGADR